MMYESPFTVIYGEPIYKQLNDEFENAVMECVASYNISVDKDELIKALQYDRDQYEKGYADGLNERPEVVMCKDCKWWTQQCNSLQGRCELMQMYPTGTWFCGNAQKEVKDERDYTD